MRYLPQVRTRGGRGFTLLELLVVISVIVLLIALLLPGLAVAKQAMYATGCASNQRQLGLAMAMYLQDWKQVYPTNHVGLFYTNTNPPIEHWGFGTFYPLKTYLIDNKVCDCPGIGSRQNYVVNSVWHWYEDDGLTGTTGIHCSGLDLEGEAGKLREVVSPSHVTQLWEMARPTGVIGEMQRFFVWYTMWAPNGYNYPGSCWGDGYWTPRHAGYKCMNYTFVDGHVALYDCTNIPDGPIGFSADWPEMNISTRKTFVPY